VSGGVVTSVRRPDHFKKSDLMRYVRTHLDGIDLSLTLLRLNILMDLHLSFESMIVMVSDHWLTA
jgi:hypothetical protein